MDKDRLNKLDQLFQEKLQEHEISPEEDYWPFLEQSLKKISFYKFGWKHINIYNLSFGILLLAIPAFYLLFQSDKKKPEPSVSPKEIISSDQRATDTLMPSEPEQKSDPATEKKKRKESTGRSKVDSTGILTNVKKTDSLPIINFSEEKTNIVTDPPKVEEKKPKAKKIIYLVQQDTIVEKDTVKVRRKRKK